MRKLQQFFSAFTDSNAFFDTLYEAFPFKRIDEHGNVFRRNIERKIWPMLRQASYFLIEDTYTEPEWKDIIAEHFIHTKYQTIPNVLRIHLFTDNGSDLNKSYLGCFTLRKIDNPTIMLSFIYPNWNVLCMEECRFADSYLITAPKRIHIFAEEITIRTTPHFVQDGIVTSCAHASIVMMTQFLNLKYGYQKLHIKDMIQSYQNREKQFPTRGLLPEQVMEILTNNKFNVVKYELGDRNPEQSEREEVKDLIKAHLRSGLPVMLGIADHSVLIVGFQEEKDSFLFLDDSGALIHTLNEAQDRYQDSELEYDNFISNCSWDYIFEYVKQTSGKKALVQFLMPVHERIYAGYEDVSRRCAILEENIGDSCTEDIPYKVENKRFFMADNVDCKKFVNENMVKEDGTEELLDAFICTEQPHYLWCYEFEVEQEIYIIFIDTTYDVEAEDNDIYINKNREPFHVAAHFPTVDKVKTCEIDDIPLFEIKQPARRGLKTASEDKLGSKRAHISGKDATGPLGVVSVEYENAEDQKKESKNENETENPER